MSFFSKTAKSKIIVVLDMASSSVGGALFEQNGDEPIKVLATTRRPVNFLLDINMDAGLRCAKESLSQVIDKLKEFHRGRVGGVLCVFSSPWFMSRTKTATVVGEKPFEIKKDFFKRLIREEELKMSDASSPFIEHEIIKTELNGYFTRRPYGKKAKSVKSYIYLSVSAQKPMKLVEKESIRAFGHTPLVFRTLPLVAFRVLDDIMNHKEGFLIIDIGGETTEVLFVRDNALEQSLSFSVGASHLFRKIASNTNAFFKEAPSILKTYARGHRSMDSSERIADAIKEVSDDWCYWLLKSFAEAAKENQLPQNVFLIGDELAEKYFAPCLTKGVVLDFTILGKPFNVCKFQPEWLAHYFKKDDNITKGDNRDSSRKDILLMLEMIYGNKIFNQNDK